MYGYSPAMATAKPMSWGMIIAILVGASLVMGLTLGILQETIGLNPGAGVGAGIGIIGALLINKRRRALAEQNKQPSAP